MIGWLNGELNTLDTLRIDPRDRGFLLGDGLFETLLAEDGTLRRVRRHLTRLRNSAGRLGIPLNHSDGQLVAICSEVLGANDLHIGRAAVRLTLTRGVGPRGIAPPANTEPTILITAASAALPPDSCRAIISSQVRAELSVSSQIKSLNYLQSVMARREAATQGADDALMHNTAGRLAEASAANLFLWVDDALVTPSIEEGALPGVMRSVVLEAADNANMTVQERPVDEDELWMASEAFLTNSLIGVCPLTEVDGRAIGPGTPGPVAHALFEGAQEID